MGGLFFRDSEGGDVEAVGLGEPAGGRAVAAADVGEVIAGLEMEGGGKALEEVEGGVFDAAGVVFVVPESVVDVIAPGESVEVVELVVVVGDVEGGERDLGGDHAGGVIAGGWGEASGGRWGRRTVAGYRGDSESMIDSVDVSSWFRYSW